MHAKQPQAEEQTVDLLDLPFRSGEGIQRNGGEFAASRPWAFARFGKVRLKSGWWLLDYKCASPVSDLEIRLSSAHDPLICLRADQPGARILLRSSSPYEISLLLNPWPGAIMFKRLLLRHASSMETVKVYVSAFRRLARNPNPVRLLTRAAQRVLAGQAVGLSIGARGSDADVAAASEPEGNTKADTGSPEQILDAPGFRVFCDVGETLHPKAVAIAAEEFARRPEIKALYADVIEAGAIVPRPKWDPELARHFNLAGSPIFLRNSGSAASTLDDARQALKKMEPSAIDRIALPLGSRRVRPAYDAPAIPVPELRKPPLVSIVIPTKIRIDLLERCLNSLAAATGYPNLEVIVVDNQSDHPDLKRVLDAASEKLKLTTIVDPGGFNFPRLINNGVRKSTGEIVLLLNDDVEAFEPGWLHRMVESALDPAVGAVGCRLLYPDRTVQHAGVVMGIGGACGHLWKGLTPEAQAHNPYVSLPSQRLAVTGACLVVRREAFDKVKGLDEAAFPVAFNDIDFCLRLRAAGLRNIYRGDAVLIHHESQSRGPDDLDAARRRRLAAESERLLARWGRALEDDPFGSPAFNPEVETGAVRPSLLQPADPASSQPRVGAAEALDVAGERKLSGARTTQGRKSAAQV